MATLASIAFAGLAFGLVVLAATLLGLWARRRAQRAPACAPTAAGPVDLELTVSHPDA